MQFANIFTVIDDVIWSENRCMPQAAESRFWRALDQLRRARLTQEADDLLISIGVLFRFRAAASRKDAVAEMTAVKCDLTEARRRCLPKLSIGTLARCSQEMAVASELGVA